MSGFIEDIKKNYIEKNLLKDNVRFPIKLYELIKNNEVRLKPAIIELSEYPNQMGSFLFMIEKNKDIALKREIINVLDDINDIGSLFVLYLYFYKEENNIILNNKILNLLNTKRVVLNHYYYDFLYVFCVINDLEIENYLNLLTEDRTSFDDEVRFIKSDKILEEKSTYSGSKIIFNIDMEAILKEKDNYYKYIFMYINNKFFSSSSFSYEGERFDFLSKLLDYNDFPKFISELKSSEVLKLIRFDIYQIAPEEQNIKKLYDKKKKYEKETGNKFKLKYNLKPIEYTKKEGLDVKKLETKDLLLFANNVLEKNCWFNGDKRDSLIYLLKELTDRIADYKEYEDYPNIKRAMIYYYVEYYNNFKQASEDYWINVRDANFYQMILIEKYANELFFKDLIAYGNKFDDTLENKIKYLNVSSQVLSKQEFKKLLYKKFNKSVLINVYRSCNTSYFYDVYRDFVNIVKNNVITNLILEEFVKIDEKHTIDDIYKKFKGELDLTIFYKYVLKNKKYYKNNILDGNLLIFLFKKKVITEDIYKENLERFLDYNYDNIKYLRLLSNPKDFINSLEVKSQFVIKYKLYNEFNSEEKLKIEKEDIFEFLLKNKVELLSDVRVIKAIFYKADDNDNTFEFLNKLVKYNKDISFVSGLLEIADYLNIEIPNRIKNEFYFVLSKEAEEFFEI